jgi:hypothetical protein
VRIPRRWAGVLLLTAALVLLLYPLVQGQQDGWPVWAYLMMSLSAPVFAAFTGWELARKRSPLVELRMFRQRGFAVGMTIGVIFFLGVASFALVLTLLLQEGLGFTPLHAGLTFLPFSLGTFAASGAAAGLEPRFGSRVTMAGALIMVAGMIGLIGTVHHFGAAVSTWDMAPFLPAAGLGLGTVIAPLANVILAGVAERDAGSASVAVKRDFTAAVERTLWFQAAVFALAFVLMLGLPGRKRAVPDPYHAQRISQPA